MLVACQRFLGLLHWPQHNLQLAAGKGEETMSLAVSRREIGHESPVRFFQVISSLVWQQPVGKSPRLCQDWSGES